MHPFPALSAAVVVAAASVTARLPSSDVQLLLPAPAAAAAAVAVSACSVAGLAALAAAAVAAVNPAADHP
jgi:hypothetical protein